MLSENTTSSKDKVVNSLRELLNNGDEVDKCNASRALGSIGATEAIDDLASKLRDDDIDVCIDAAEALGNLRANHIVPQLMESLKNDPDGELKTAIVKSLGVIRSPVSIPALLEIAQHRPENMIIDSNDDWDDWWDMQRQAIIALGKMKASEATQVLNDLLATDDVLDIEIDILNALVNIDQSGEKIVIEHLINSPALTRRRAASALSLSSSPKSLKALASAFTDNSEDVRLNALQALVDRKAVKYLSAIELLKKDRSEKVRQAAILAYDKLDPLPESKKSISLANEHLLNDPDAEVRSTYLKSLQSAETQIDEEELTTYINTALIDKNELVILSAIPLLLKLSDPALAEAQLIKLIARPKLPSQILTVCISTLAQVLRWNVNISRILTRLINHTDPSIRMASLHALMTIEQNINDTDIDPHQSKTPIDVINETLNGRVILEIEVSSFTKPKTQKAADLDEVSADEDTTDDSSASNEKEPEQVALSTLESIMQDSQKIEQSLIETGNQPSNQPQDDPSIDEYRDLIQDNIVKGDWLFNEKEEVSIARDVQRLSARLLSRLPAHLSDEKSTLIINSLLNALNSDDIKLRTYAAESLAQIAIDNPHTPGIENTFGGLVTQFHDEHWDLKLACMKALAAIRNRAAIPILMSALHHKRSALRIQAIQSISDLQLNGDELLKNAHVPELPPTLTEWIDSLILRLQDNEAGVRYSAVNNLKRCLLSDEISQQQELIDKAIEHIVQSAFINQGGRTRDMARVLQAIEPVQGTDRLVQLLKELSTSYERRFAIEMLEEMYRTDSDSVAVN